MNRLDALRKTLGTSFGAVALVAGAMFSLLGIVCFVFGVSIALYGQGHYPPILAVLILPAGALCSFVGYGAIRLGWDFVRSNARRANPTP
jgi:amino acid transporter